MLGLADRGRVLDIFEKLMGGKIAEALADLQGLYDAGADPLAVMQDLLETTHFLTRVKVAPAAQGFFDGGSGEAKRAAELAAKLSVPALTRAWQILLKGLFEVRDATRPISACEMALIRLAYAAELPPTDKLVKDLLDGGAVARAAQAVARLRRHRLARSPVASGAAMPARAPMPQGAPTASIRTLEDIVALCEPRSELRVNLEHNVHLVRLEPGRIEIRPTPRAPRTLANDLQSKLRSRHRRALDGFHRQPGRRAHPGRTETGGQDGAPEAVAQEPMVRAVLDRFPGAEIVAVRDVASRRHRRRRCRTKTKNENQQLSSPAEHRGDSRDARGRGPRWSDRVRSFHLGSLPLAQARSLRSAGNDKGAVMAAIGSEIERLIQLLAKLPGLGPRSARRAALALLKKRDTLLEPLADSLREAADAILTCEICGNLDTQSPCAICSDPRRDPHILCVVEDVADLWALERAGVFRGRYHVLGGALSALDGVTPDRLNVGQLAGAGLESGSGQGVDEVILAMNATVEGQTTAHYLMDLLGDRKVTRLAHGVPVGGELDYLDEGTLSAAFKARRAL